MLSSRGLSLHGGDTTARPLLAAGLGARSCPVLGAFSVSWGRLPGRGVLAAPLGRTWGSFRGGGLCRWEAEETLRPFSATQGGERVQSSGC